MRRRAARRIVLTGGPGGGKTTAADLFRRELQEAVRLVPEAATILFGGGFPRGGPPDAQRAAQRAIYSVQRNLEDVVSALDGDRLLLCDRGTPDGAAYWPDGPEAFFADLNTSLDAELGRYDAVIFFESAAVGGLSVASGNPVRNESTAQAATLDAALRELYGHHPRLTFVRHDPSFFRKITMGLAALEQAVTALGRDPR